MHGSANRLWRLTDKRYVNCRRSYVVKELPHVLESPWLEALQLAARFEWSVWETGEVNMPEPIKGADGELVALLPGTREATVAVRVHRCSEGRPVEAVECGLARRAGRVLRRIRDLGRGFHQARKGLVQPDSTDARAVVEQLLRRGHLKPDVGPALMRALDEGRKLVSVAEQRSEDWIFTHVDHKPENALTDGRTLIVLDWDESRLCSPRLETVESALRWAGVAFGVSCLSRGS